MSLVGWPMGWLPGSPPCCVSLFGDGGVRPGEPRRLACWLAGWFARDQKHWSRLLALPPLRRRVAYHFSGAVEYGLVSQLGCFGIPLGCSNVVVRATY